MKRTGNPLLSRSSKQAKLLALQRDIDEQSQPTKPATSLKSQRISVNRSADTKMEEEKRGERITKERKHKKGKIFSQEIHTFSAEDESKAKVKKVKKWTNIENVAKEEEEQTDHREEKKKKKHDSISVTDVIHVKDETRRKKKLLEDNMTLNNEKSEKKKRKEKLLDKSVQVKPERLKKEEEMQIEDVSPEKLKKEKNNVVVSSIGRTEEISREKKKKNKKTAVITDGDGETKAKKKAKVLENWINVEKEETEVKEVKFKKKKDKKSKTKGFENELIGTEVKRKKKRKVEDEEILQKKEDRLKNEQTEVKIEKNKTSKKAQEEEEVETEEMQPKKKKKKKKVKVEEDDGGEDVCGRDCSIPLAADSQSKRAKKKKNSVKEEQDINTESEAGEKKKKAKKKTKDQQGLSQVDVVFLSSKTGNTDEVFINQERRKALQQEIDVASQPHNLPDKPTALGQWSTAQFDSSQQQQKFLRLMGGLKKGFQPAGATTGGANMALGKDAQQKLQQGLLGEFERAHTRRMDFSNRGAGLGFTAPSSKKFSIDINASRSVRFDD